MKWIPKKLKRVIVMVLSLALICGSVGKPEAVFAEGNYQTYKIYVSTWDNQEITEELSATAEVQEAYRDKVACKAPATVSDGDAGSGEGQTYGLLKSGSIEAINHYVEVQIDSGAAGDGEWAVDVTITYPNYASKVVTITNESDLVLSTTLDAEVSNRYTVSVTLKDVKNDGEIVTGDFSVVLSSEIEHEIVIDDEADSATITFTERENDVAGGVWPDKKVSIGYAGYGSKEVTCVADNTESTTLYPQVEIIADDDTGDGNKLYPGETATFTLSPVSDIVELNVAEVEWSLADGAVGTLTSTGSYTAPTDVDTDADITVKARYNSSEYNDEVSANYLFHLESNPDVSDVTSLDKNGSVYYVEEVYNINPVGYSRYSVGDRLEDLPLTNEATDKVGLSTVPATVRFYQATGAVSLPYRIAIDKEKPYFADNATITVVPQDAYASQREIIIPWDSLKDDGVGNITVSYKCGEGAAQDLVSPNNITLSETAPAQTYYFIVKDKFNNNRTYDVTVPAIDATKPSVAAVCVVNGETESEIENGGVVYTNKALTLKCTLADEGSYTSGIKSVVFYADAGKSDELCIAQVDGTSAEGIIAFEDLQNIDNVYVVAKDNVGNESDLFEFGVVVDNTDPVVEWDLYVDDEEKDKDSYVISAADVESGVDIKVQVSDEALDVFKYIVGGTETSVSADEIQNSNGEVSIPLGSKEDVIGDITLIALDKAGNQTSEPIDLQSDLEGPEIKLFVGEDKITVDSMFVTDSTNVKVTVSDDKDQEQDIELTVSCGDAMVPLIDGSFTFNPADEDEIREEVAVYEVVATDSAGNETIKELTLKYDNNAPEIALQWHNDGAEVSGTWLNAENVKEMSIQASIEDVTHNNGDVNAVSGFASATITGGALENTSEAFDKNSGYTISMPSKDIEHTYTITAWDNAGNEKSESIYVKVDITAPVVTCDAPTAWYKTDSVTLSVGVEDKTSGVSELNYKIYPMGEVSEANLEQSGTIEVDGKNVTASVPVTTGNGNWVVYLSATDVAGNASEEITVSVKIDTNAPTADRVYAEYDEVEIVTLPDKLLNIFGQISVGVKLYLQDNIDGLERTVDYSDLKEIEVKYGSKTYTVNPTDGAVALLGSEGNYVEVGENQASDISEVFRVFEFNLKDQFDENVKQQISDKLKVVKIVDNAGKEWVSADGVEPQNLDDTTIKAIIVDGIAPELNEVNYGSYVKSSDTDDNRYYYNAATDIGLAIKEHFFQEANKTPEVTVITNGEPNALEGMTWNGTNDVYSSSVNLSVSSGDEMEYQVKVSYADGAGNKMIPGENTNYSITEGTFTTPVLVVDNNAPVLESLQITAMEGGSITEKDGCYYATTLLDGADVKVAMQITDKYFNDKNLTVQVLKDGNVVSKPIMSEIISTPTDGGADINFTFDGEANVAGSYTFKISYKDNAGNLLVRSGEDANFADAAQGSHDETTGTYTTTSGLVISNRAPEITALTVKPAKGNVTNKNETYYYMPADDNKDDAVFSVTIADTNFDEDKAEISYTTDNGDTWVPFSDVDWTESGSGYNKSHTTSVSVDGVANAETEYRFAVEYTNGNGQKLVLGSKCKPSGAATGAMVKDENDVQEDRYETTVFTVVDNKVPELTGLTITEADGSSLIPDGDESTATTYYHDINNPGKSNKKGVKVVFTLDDNETYFDTKNVTIVFGKETVAQKNLTWGKNGRNQTLSFIIEGESGKSYEYDKLKITYADQSGRKMVLADDVTFNQSGITRGKMSNGRYTTDTKIVIDRKAPVLSAVTFKVPYQYTNASNKTVDKITGKKNKLFYNSNAVLNFGITEDNWNSAKVEVKLFKKAPEATKYAEVTNMPKVSYEDSTAKFTIIAKEDHSADGEYYFTVKYIDPAGNELTAGNNQTTDKKGDGLYDDCVSDASYTSPVIVIDTTAPDVQVEYSGTVIGSLKKPKIDFYNKRYSATVTVTERNFRVDELVKWAKVESEKTNATDDSENTADSGITLKQWSFDDEGTRVYTSFNDIRGSKNILNYAPTTATDDKYSLKITMQDEGNYELGVTYVDLAGNKATVDVKQTALDKTAPSMEVSYEVEDTGMLDFIKYGDLGYIFAQKKVTVTTEATDNVAGIQNIRYDVYKNKNGKLVKSGSTEESTKKQAYKKTLVETIPLSSNTQDFDGLLEIAVLDRANNENGTSRNYLIESAGTYKSNAGAGITIDTTPSRSVGGVKYYNASAGTVNFTVNASENYSGLRSVKVAPILGSFNMNTNAMEGVPANQSMDGTYLWNVRNNINGINGAADPGSGKPTADLTEEELVKMGEASGEKLVKQFKHAGSFAVKSENDLNDIAVQMDVVTNTGYMQSVQSEPFVIDITAPTVTVAFNDIPASNSNYYKDVRVATITITERNFLASDIVWNITNTEGAMPEISGFTNDDSGKGSSNDTTHVGTVTFAEDGVYTFGFDFMDKAGNSVSFETDPFTIDLTKPVIDVSFADGNNEGATAGYYKEARTATVIITERNFKADDVNIVMTANDSVTNVSVPFRSNGDEHSATIAFDYDADFTLDVSYVDMAGNEADVVEKSEFVVDLTDPVVNIIDWESERETLNNTANKGIIMPTIEVTDTNFDIENINVTLSGYKNGVVYQRGMSSDKYPVTESVIANGRKFIFNDFAYEADVDDLYTLKATITDKAGRTVEDKVMFSVNRFGSTYQFDEATAQLLENYYTKEAKDLVITETNVDTLEFKELYIMRDGEKISLKEKDHYTVEEKVERDSETGQAISWKQYIYTIKAENFAQDGVYNVVIYSEDRAENVSDNRTKDMSVEFIVDTVSPIVAVSGIESGGQYTMDERLVTIDVKDNMELDSLQLYLNYSDQPFATFTAEEIQQAGGVVSQMIKSSSDLQTLIVVATDKAGNENTVAVEDFLITSNIFVQFYRNTPLFLGSIAVVTLGGAGAIYGLIFRKKQ